jgi:hypothetical protein
MFQSLANDVVLNCMLCLEKILHNLNKNILLINKVICNEGNLLVYLSKNTYYRSFIVIYTELVV